MVLITLIITLLISPLSPLSRFISRLITVVISTHEPPSNPVLEAARQPDGF